MPRRNSGARLRWLEKRNCFYIVWTENGRSRERSTGTADRKLAEAALADFSKEGAFQGKKIAPLVDLLAERLVHFRVYQESGQ
mgnify:CR=1 FL=1